MIIGVILGVIFILSGLFVIGLCIYAIRKDEDDIIIAMVLGIIITLAGVGIVFTMVDHTGIVYDISNFKQEVDGKPFYNTETKEIIEPEKPMKRIVIQYKNKFYLMEVEDYEYLSLKEGDNIAFCYGEVEAVEVASGGN